MGDLLMSSPAIRALKETFRCRITLLTSAMGNKIAPFIKEIDETIVADLPWIKTKNPVSRNDFFSLIEILKKKRFDGAVIFSVYSQNPLPAAMMAFMAGIPQRLAYCRENPYHLLSDWIVEKEPFSFIHHQVRRDLNLVKAIHAETKDEQIRIHISESSKINVIKKIKAEGVNLHRDWLILHPGVSETKREYTENNWIEAGKLLRDHLSFQLLITGASFERELCERITEGIGAGAFCLAGLSIEELTALIHEAPLVISVNTGTAHIAAATQTPVIVLYALTNPQHTPWNVASEILYFSVKEQLKSKNEIVNYVNEYIMDKGVEMPSPLRILEAAQSLLKKVKAEISYK
jgi:ADP-heptose:LPS heptosyltransferase